jgi:glutaredoxin
METQVLGLSVDSVPTLAAWAESLGGISYPLLSDFFPHGEIADLYGVLREDGRSERAIFVIDKLGIIRYVDVHDIDEQPDNEELFRVLSEIEPVLAAKWEADNVIEDPEPEPDAEVVLYCTPWCPACRRARAFLSENNIDYVEIDVTRDRAAAERVRGWANGYQTTPTFNIRGQIIVNFKRKEVADALGVPLPEY